MKKISLFISIITLAGSVYAQRGKSYWNPIPESEIQVTGERTIIPNKYKTYHLSGTDLKNLLFSAPNEDKVSLRNSQVIVELPLPDGSIQKFRVVEAPVMAPELAAQYPNIKTFNIEGVEDPRANGKLDWNDFGFHGMIRRPSGDLFIDPYSRNNTSDYISYYTADFNKNPKDVIPEVGVRKDGKDVKDEKPQVKKNGVSGLGERSQAMICSGTKLRKYRLALACTHEYAQAATGKSAPTTSEILSAVTTSVNRVDGIYETEAAIRMVLIANESLILYGTNAGDPFTGNDDANVLINESQTIIDNKISTANYDIGHTFSTGGGGLAELGCVCNSASKASGITGSSQPVGDPYDVDYVAHEMGHQFGGDHTFSANTSNCGGGNGNASTAVEPGSGITIMAYAGICGTLNDIDPHSIAYFHTISFDEIMAYSNTGGGNACPVTTTTTNHPPVVTIAASTVNIPFSTPFTLTGSATDQDNDSLTYSWEEIDANYGIDWNSGNKPFFRSYDPIASPSRTFPKSSIVLIGPTAYKTTRGEYLPSDAQNLTFRLIARDNKMGGGGVCYASTKVVIANAGPFAVSYPNNTGITWPGASIQTVTWDVNKTDLSPISCANVNILLSIDSGLSFNPILSNTPNDGSQVITVPQQPTDRPNCRIRVEAAGNIFFDINDNDFTITSTVGIHELSGLNTLGVQLIPNPAHDQLQLSIYGLNKNTSTHLTVYDMLGNIVLNDLFSGKEQITQNYALTALSKGVYIVEVRNEQQKSMSRLVKQ
jgi:hypothetical protein